MPLRLPVPARAAGAARDETWRAAASGTTSNRGTTWTEVVRIGDEGKALVAREGDGIGVLRAVVADRRTSPVARRRRRESPNSPARPAATSPSADQARSTSPTSPWPAQAWRSASSGAAAVRVQERELVRAPAAGRGRRGRTQSRAARPGCRSSCLWSRGARGCRRRRRRRRRPARTHRRGVGDLVAARREADVLDRAAVRCPPPPSRHRRCSAAPVVEGLQTATRCESRPDRSVGGPRQEPRTSADVATSLTSSHPERPCRCRKATQRRPADGERSFLGELFAAAVGVAIDFLAYDDVLVYVIDPCDGLCRRRRRRRPRAASGEEADDKDRQATHDTVSPFSVRVSYAGSGHGGRSCSGGARADTRALR